MNLCWGIHKILGHYETERQLIICLTLYFEQLNLKRWVFLNEWWNCISKISKTANKRRDSRSIINSKQHQMQPRCSHNYDRKLYHWNRAYLSSLKNKRMKNGKTSVMNHRLCKSKQQKDLFFWVTSCRKSSNCSETWWPANNNSNSKNNNSVTPKEISNSKLEQKKLPNSSNTVDRRQSSLLRCAKQRVQK